MSSYSEILGTYVGFKPTSSVAKLSNVSKNKVILQDTNGFKLEFHCRSILHGCV